MNHQVQLQRANNSGNSGNFGKKRAPTRNLVTTVEKAKKKCIVSKNVRSKELRKLELCWYYERGICKHQNNPTACTFAHGKEDLRILTPELRQRLEKIGLLPSLQSWRTLPCFAFTSTGSCPFGTRCAFIHDARCSRNQAIDANEAVVDGKVMLSTLQRYSANSYYTPAADCAEGYYWNLFLKTLKSMNGNGDDEVDEQEPEEELSSEGGSSYCSSEGTETYERSRLPVFNFIAPECCY